jgi:hypothetical protein
MCLPVSKAECRPVAAGQNPDKNQILTFQADECLRPAGAYTKVAVITLAMG